MLEAAPNTSIKKNKINDNSLKALGAGGKLTPSSPLKPAASFQLWKTSVGRVVYCINIGILATGNYQPRVKAHDFTVICSHSDGIKTPKS